MRRKELQQMALPPYSHYLLVPFFLIETRVPVKDDLRWFGFWGHVGYEQFSVALYCWICRKYPC